MSLSGSGEKNYCKLLAGGRPSQNHLYRKPLKTFSHFNLLNLKITLKYDNSAGQFCLFTTCQWILKVTPCTRIPGESLQAKLHTVHHQDTFSCIQRLRTESGRCIDGVMKKNIGNFAFNWRVIFVYNQITGQVSILISFTWRSSTESTWLNISISPVSSLYTYAALFTYSLKTMLLLIN